LKTELRSELTYQESKNEARRSYFECCHGVVSRSFWFKAFVLLGIGLKERGPTFLRSMKRTTLKPILSLLIYRSKVSFLLYRSRTRSVGTLLVRNKRRTLSPAPVKKIFIGVVNVVNTIGKDVKSSSKRRRGVGRH